MSRKLVLTIMGVAAVAVATVLVATLLIVTRPDDAPAESEQRPPPIPAEVLVRQDSHRLSIAEDGKATLVEFLDFECEACGAVYPAMEQVREQYEGRITYVIRYFPVPRGHPNAELAARTAEAAARQGEFEAMYMLLFERQEQWSHRPEPQREMFLGYAREIGLDLARFEADWDSKEVGDRIRRDQRDGVTAGVEGTPTFYLNGRLFQPGSLEELTGALDEALAR
ncbi:disulfide bond formation protein DsbA [Prauserella marina]|uniref:Protein-disulfide isomerase n=1 Tax=Prauserella marina TaxID=530584 RepID=A0A222VSZ1_9PSEU|nr:thioredoxin domain-containing protein [Prauserella marina]ASR37046.1 disulfide bond formation protein DsbA [Prauserella marina]PWV79976.1 protein-disulfide isomerase [Prauserella marina]SDD85836.1 Protein-disulfide isomerase [Prauserella marina]